jgi:hypothetical protein
MDYQKNLHTIDQYMTGQFDHLPNPKLWQERGLTDYINGMYEQYHTERLENAFADIDRKS